MFALPRTIVVCCRLAVKIEAYGISVTLFQIFDSNSRHVEGRRVAPANLDASADGRSYGNGVTFIRVCCGNTVNYVDRVCRCIPSDPTYRYRC